MIEFDPEKPCDGCPNTCKKRKSKAKLRKGAPFLIVGKQPSYETLKEGRFIPPKARQTLMAALDKADLLEEDFSWANSVRCEYDETKYPAPQRKEIEKRCRQHLINVIKYANPEVIVPLGAVAAKQVFGRAVKITKVRGLLNYSEEFGCQIMPMSDPVQVNMYPQNLPILRSDAEALYRAWEYRYDKQAIEDATIGGDYHLVDDLQFLIDEDPEILGFDVETQGTRPHDRRCELLTLQFCPEPGRAYILSWDHPDRPMPKRSRARIKQQLIQLLCKPGRKLIGQNLKFDAAWLLRRLGIHIRISDDTLMMATVLNENLLTKDLDTLTKIYVPEMAGYADAFNATYDKSDMKSVPLNKIVGYGCGDTDAALRAYYAMLPLIQQDEKLYASYRYVSMAGINAFLSFETDGMPIDEVAFDEFETVLQGEVTAAYSSLIRQVSREIRREHVEKGLEFTRADFIRDILFIHKKGLRLRPKVFTKSTANLEPKWRVPSISTKDHLPYFYEDHPFTYELAQYIKNNRILGTNVKRFRENYLHFGSIYPIYQLWVAVTGRTSSRDPNGQNFPKRGKAAKAYRKIFIPPPGHVLLEADLSQAELRIAADMANDRTMIEIYQNDGDIHTRTACIVMGCSEAEFAALPKEERSLARFKAKAVNFGFLYGMWWKKFIAYAKTQYGVEFTEKEAEAVRKRFFATYTELEPWHRGMKEFARMNGFVRSYDGRIRHLPTVWSDTDYIQKEAERQAINSPVQEFASSWGLMAISRLTSQVDPQYLRITSFVHDAIYASVPEQYVEWGAKTLKHYMETNPVEEWFGRKMRVPMKADVGFGMNGGDMHEMAGLSLDDAYDFAMHTEAGGAEHVMDFELPCQEVPPGNGRFILPAHLQAPEQIHLWV